LLGERTPSFAQAQVAPPPRAPEPAPAAVPAVAPQLDSNTVQPQPTAPPSPAAVAPKPTTVDGLLARDDEEAKELMFAMVRGPGQMGDQLLSRIGSDRLLERRDVVEAALASHDRGRARSAVRVLEDLKTDWALELLTRASREHEIPAVRKDAAAAKRRLFSVGN
jgi:hypothetical protein